MVLPLGDYPVLVPGSASGLADYYLDWLAHPRYDDYWKQWSIEEQFSKIKVPGFHVAAWYDIFQDGSLKNYQGIKAQGGPVLGDTVHVPPGPIDQRPVENREDVLVYTAPAFKQDTEVTGPVTSELYVSSSAVDTDFTGKLVDAWPNGYAENLIDGILRARYRNSMEKVEFMNPGEIYKLTINLWSTSNVFLAGHKLRVEVSSSNFPRFDRNLNTGEDPESGTRMVKASNLVYHDREHASALVVPIVP